MLMNFSFSERSKVAACCGRTHAGLARAKAEGKPLGRPSALSVEQQHEVRARLQAGEPVAALARDYGTSRQTVMRVRAAMAGAPVPAVARGGAHAHV